MARRTFDGFRLFSKFYSQFNSASAYSCRKFSSRPLVNFNGGNGFVRPPSVFCRFTSTAPPKAPWMDTEMKTDLGGGFTQQGEKPPPDDEQKNRDDAWRKMKYTLIGLGAVFGICGGSAAYTLGSPKLDEDGRPIPDEFSNLPTIQQFFKRMLHELEYYNKMIKEPSRDKLLPDPLKYPYIQPPYTLVLEMTDLLVHPEWTYQTGWRFKKRPGVDKFLEQVSSPNFEVVVYTAEQGLTVFPILDSLDPNGFIMFRLVRDATDFIDGHHVKNLDCLNRDLKKFLLWTSKEKDGVGGRSPPQSDTPASLLSWPESVFIKLSGGIDSLSRELQVIVVDWNENSVRLHPNNAFLIPRWKGNDDDTTLVDLAAFLRTIAANEVEDVRDVLTYYREFENPVEAFRENQRKLLEQMEEREKYNKEKQQSSTLASKWAATNFLKR